MRKIILLLTCILITSCKKDNEENEKINSSNIEVDNNLSSIHFSKDTVGYYDNFEKVKKITFQEVEESEYLKLETQKTIEKNEDLIIDKKGITIKGTNLVSEIDLKKSKNREFEYLGYYPSLNLYAISENSSSEDLSFSDFIYLNLKDKKLTKIVSSNSDSKIENPVISIKNNFLAYYCNTLYETNNSFLGVLKIEENNKLTEFAYFETEEYKIQDIKWDNNDNIFIKVIMPNNKIKYLKNSSEKDNNKKELFDYTVIQGKSFSIKTQAKSYYDNNEFILKYYISFNKNKTAILSIGAKSAEDYYCEGEYKLLSENNTLHAKGKCDEDDTNDFYIKKIDGHYFIKSKRFLNNDWQKLDEND